MDASPQRLDIPKEIPKEIDDIEEVSDAEPLIEKDQEKAQEENVLKEERNSAKELSEGKVTESLKNPLSVSNQPTTNWSRSSKL